MGSKIYAKIFKQNQHTYSTSNKPIDNKDSHEYDHKPAKSDIAQTDFINAKLKKLKQKHKKS